MEQPRAQKIMIQIKDLRKEYTLGDEVVVALKRINLEIMRGEICCILGTSGSGKSTLLNQLAGMEKPTYGEVNIGGVPISALDEDQLAAFRQRYLGFVFFPYADKTHYILGRFGWKIKLSHNGTSLEADPTDRFKGSVFRVSFWKSV